jgi:biopolymer transport protein ExbD
MGLQRRNKVSAEFSMSSLTDIIFLLLIFFMLTATFIRIQNVDLPESDSKTVASTSVAVTIDKEGKYYLNAVEISPSSLEREVSSAVAEAEDKNSTTVTIVAEKGVPFDKVSKVMAVASKLKVRAILATQPIKG